MMEVKEPQKIVISKPVAWKPSLTNSRSFKDPSPVVEVSPSPPAAIPETTVAAIRPRTVRFKNAELLSPACHPSDKAPESNTTSSVLYKPIPTLVSNTTISLLAKLRSRDVGLQQETAEVVQPCNQPTQHAPDFHSGSLPLAGTNRDGLQENQEDSLLENHEIAVSENHEDNHKFSVLLESGDRTAYDGHNWRKYGQKQVKGSEYPRSYYKCTYPNCPVKKKVERTLDGQIAEIVYKGEHSHQKPHPLKNTPADIRSARDAVRKELRNPSSSSQQPERVQLHEGISEHRVGSMDETVFSGTVQPINDPTKAGMCNASGSASNNYDGQIREHEAVNEALETVPNDVKSKRRKSENRVETNAVGEAAVEPRIVIQKSNDFEMVGDGYRWRKYGQKVVKGNPYPRSYYRCTSPKCSVRKHIERTSEDNATCITTYEGRHNHEPIKGANSDCSKTNTKNKP